MYKKDSNICKSFDSHRYTMCHEEYKKNKRFSSINQPSHYMSYIGRIKCSFIDTMSLLDVPGIIFNEKFYYKRNWMEIPPKFLPNKKIIYLEKAINLLQVYGATHSHFIIETIPRLSYALKVIPEEIPLIIETNNYVNQFLTYLKEIGVIKNRKIIEWNKKQNVFYFVNDLYFVSEFPGHQNDCNHWNSIETHSRAHNLFVKDLPIDERDLIVLVSRKDATERFTTNEKELIEELSKLGKLYVFVGSEHKNVTKLMNVMKRAKILISVHGAGLSNGLWVGKCTTIIEMMYTDLSVLPTPSGFYTLAINRHLDYWLSFAEGYYGGSIMANIQEIVNIVKKVLIEKKKIEYENNCWEIGNEDDSRKYV